jgi:hypothetical protein
MTTKLERVVQLHSQGLTNIEIAQVMGWRSDRTVLRYKRMAGLPNQNGEPRHTGAAGRDPSPVEGRGLASGGDRRNAGRQLQRRHRLQREGPGQRVEQHRCPLRDQVPRTLG